MCGGSKALISYVVRFSPLWIDALAQIAEDQPLEQLLMKFQGGVKETTTSQAKRAGETRFWDCSAIQHDGGSELLICTSRSRDLKGEPVM